MGTAASNRAPPRGEADGRASKVAADAGFRARETGVWFDRRRRAVVRFAAVSG